MGLTREAEMDTRIWHKVCLKLCQVHVQRANHFVAYGFAPLRWRVERGLDRVSDKPCAISSYPFLPLELRPCHIGGESVSRTALSGRNHHVRLRASGDVRQMRSS